MKKIQNDIVNHCSDLLHAVKIRNKYDNFKKNNIKISNNLELEYQNANSIFDVYDNNIDLIVECNKISNDQYNRYKRTRKWLTRCFACVDSAKRGHMYFITLTFNDNVMEKTNAKTRRKYVTKILNKYSVVYMANIDYGENTEREHYHAIILTEFELKYDDFISDWQKLLKQSQHVQVEFEKITLNENSIAALPKYLNKLTNHAYKDTTTAYCIYCKDFVNKLEHFHTWETITDDMELPFDF